MDYIIQSKLLKANILNVEMKFNGQVRMMNEKKHPVILFILL